MFTPRKLCASSFLILCLLSKAFSQGEQPGGVGQKASQTNTTVTAAASAERVRFTAPSNIVRMQLQVISESGQILFDVSSKGNVLDWSLQDSSGQGLQGSYLIVVTVKSLSGRLTERVGSVSIREKQVELQRVETTQLAAAQQQTVGPIEENSALTILNTGEAQDATVIANNGQEGQIIRDRGGLSFRLGDFFSGTDKEQMRLTEAGNLGIGTSEPEFKLDVVGAVRARQGFMFGNGSSLNVNDKGVLTLTGSDGSVVPNATGSGTQNRIAKWIDNAGTLGDSNIIEDSSNRVGIGTTNPGAKFHTVGVQGSIGAGTFQLDTPTLFSNWTATYPAFEVLNTNQTNNNVSLFQFSDVASGAAHAGIGAVATNHASKFGDLFFFTKGPDGYQLRMGIYGGNVGIGNTTPGAKLDVTGNINTSTQYNIGGNRILSVAGINNAFVGVGAANLNTTGQQNSYFGASAGSLNTIGNRNSFFGSQAGAATTNGANSFFGYQAGSQNSTGGFNSFFGDNAGVDNVGGSLNTTIGFFTNVGSGSLTNATAIGANAQVNTSNSLVLGSVAGVNSASANTNVGIGTAAPSATLHVVSYTNSAGENTATFQAPTIGSNQSHIHYGTTGDWYIRSAVSAGKVILQDSCCGNVGIGTGSPIAKLDVRDGTGASGGGAHIQIGADSANTDTKIIIFGNTGCGTPFDTCVSIGEEGVDNRMVLRATDSFRFSGGNLLPDIDTNLALGSASNRWSAVYAVNGAIQTSDARLKRSIANLKYGLSQVMQLRPVSFQWKNGNDKNTHLGLIAQEVDAVLPEAVQKSADENAPLGMNYSNLIPVLIKAIQEQQGALDRAQGEIKTLRTENEALSRRINSIEAKSTVATSTKKASVKTPQKLR